ncbi:MAG: Rpn family recombination-promoting nuclease/putative transposase [Paenibacillaceae bacterium]
MAKRNKPKNDLIFQLLFGNVEDKEGLISLLNAVLRLEGAARIFDLTVIASKELVPEWIDDKTGRLDIRAETSDNQQFDIEMQVVNQKNMARRTLFYLSKLYVGSIKSGGKYADLKRTVTINIVDFDLFDISRFHTTFHFYEDHEELLMLTDAMEVHFIEHNKFLKAEIDLNDPLHRWLLFLDEKLPYPILKELMEMDPVIKRVEERLEWLSSDAETQRLYEAREHSLIERNSLISEGKIEGKAEGKIEGKSEVVLTMLKKGLDSSLIQELTGFSIDDIERLKDSNSN